MMGKFAIAFLTLCVFQSANCKVLNDQLSRDLMKEQYARGFLDDIKKYVDELLNIIYDKLNELESFGLSLINEAEVTAISASQEVSFLVDTGITAIQKAVQEVSEGLDPTQCLVNVINGLEDLKGSTINKLTQCATQSLDLLRAILSDSMEIIRGYVSQVQGFLNDAEDCDGDWFCLASVAAQAALAAVKIPIDIGTEILKCNGLMASELAELVKCTATQIGQLTFTVKDTVVKTTECLFGLVP